MSHGSETRNSYVKQTTCCSNNTFVFETFPAPIREAAYPLTS